MIAGLIASALRAALAFAEDELENRTTAGGSMSDYINEAQDVIDRVTTALIALERAEALLLAQ